LRTVSKVKIGLITAILLLTGLILGLHYGTGNPVNYLEIGGITIAVLTLAALVSYVFDTLIMAKGSQVLAQEAQRPIIWFYVIEEAQVDARGLATATKFPNTSNHPANIFIRLNPTINGQQANTDTLRRNYTGETPILVGPHSEVNGGFSISQLLEHNGFTVDQMRVASNSENRKSQLRLEIEIWYEDLRGKRYDIPTRLPYYFDFAINRWIYDV
jgi:hypothetical protein